MDESRIVEELKKRPSGATAHQLAEALSSESVSKRDVNHALYKKLAPKRVVTFKRQGERPVWSLNDAKYPDQNSSASPRSAAPVTHFAVMDRCIAIGPSMSELVPLERPPPDVKREVLLLVDVSNRARELRSLDAALAGHSVLKILRAQLGIHVYMDWAFDGNYSNRPLALQRHGIVHFHQSNEMTKNAADTEMVWHVAQWSMASSRKTFGLMTTDCGFQRVKRLAEDCGHSFTFLRTSAEALEWLEGQTAPELDS